MATPMSATLSAGASFTPSPVMATMCPMLLSTTAMRILCSGDTRAKSTFLASSAAAKSVVGHVVEVVAGDDAGVVALDDADTASDRLGGQAVVAGDHDDFDAGSGALLDRDRDLVARRVHHRHETDEDELSSRSLSGE